MRHERRSPFEVWCSHDCAYALAMAKLGSEKRKQAAEQRKAARAERKADREKLESLRSMSWHHKQTRKAVHAYIRARDAVLPCISCGESDAAKWDAGHYKSVGGNSTLRYDLNNIHKQCSVCNQHLSGNLILYRQNLILKIGEPEVLRLEGPQPVHKWTREELGQIAANARAMTKALVLP